MLIDLENKTTFQFDISVLEEIASSLISKEVELVIVDNSTMKTLNREHRGKNTPTDVLSFPMEAPFTQQSIFGMPLGSIVISKDFILEGADKFEHSTQDELSLLFIHGLLHLIGFDHETDNGEMRVREKEIIEAFNLPSSLIVRTTI